MKWYKVKGLRGHCGAGNSLETTIYIKARSMFDAIIRYRNVPSVKKVNAGRLNDKQYINPTPDIFLANEEERERIKGVSERMRSWFYFKDELEKMSCN